MARPTDDPHLGKTTADGTIYAGISPRTGAAMYATPGDAPATMSWKEALAYAGNLNEHGFRDWRLPTKDELDVLFKNSAAIGGFDDSSLYPGGWYWTSSEDSASAAWRQRFSDGRQNILNKDKSAAVRCVRSPHSSERIQSL